MPAALARRNGAYIWRLDDGAKARFRAVDGTEMEASALSLDSGRPVEQFSSWR